MLLTMLAILLAALMYSGPQIAEALQPALAEWGYYQSSQALSGVSAQGVIYQAHAVVRHPGTAQQIRDCLNDHGPYMRFKARNHPTYYLICEFSPGSWGFQAVDQSGNEKTAFAPGEETGDFSFQGVRKYLEAFATKFDGVLPWIGH